MPYPKRFAGYESPSLLLKAGDLTRDQKISALRSWRSAATRVESAERGSSDQRRLIAEIDQALTVVSRN